MPVITLNVITQGPIAHGVWIGVLDLETRVLVYENWTIGWCCTRITICNCAMSCSLYSHPTGFPTNRFPQILILSSTVYTQYTTGFWQTFSHAGLYMKVVLKSDFKSGSWQQLHQRTSFGEAESLAYCLLILKHSCGKLFLILIILSSNEYFFLPQ